MKNQLNFNPVSKTPLSTNAFSFDHHTTLLFQGVASRGAIPSADGGVDFPARVAERVAQAEAKGFELTSKEEQELKDFARFATGIYLLSKAGKFLTRTAEVAKHTEQLARKAKEEERKRKQEEQRKAESPEGKIVSLEAKNKQLEERLAELEAKAETALREQNAELKEEHGIELEGTVPASSL